MNAHALGLVLVVVGILDVIIGFTIIPARVPGANGAKVMIMMAMCGIGIAIAGVLLLTGVIKL